MSEMSNSMPRKPAEPPNPSQDGPEKTDSAPQQLGRTNSGSIIVFDPVKQTLFTRKLKQLDTSNATKIPVPRWGNRVDVYLRNDLNTERLAATLSLDKLGWTTSLKRLTGRINHVCVMELPESSPTPIAAAA